MQCSGITVQSSYTSWRSCLLGNGFSSTSQQISSLAIQRENHLSECLIQPLQASAVMSSHVTSMAARRVICVCGWRSYTFNLHAEKNSSTGLSRVRGTPPASCCGPQTIAWWCWSDGNWHCPKLTRTLAGHLQSAPSLVQGWDPCRECQKTV